MDDPLGLLVQAVAVLAAGMYPIGFMFGACSDCCCPPCNLCNHHYDARSRSDTDVATLITLLNTSLTLNIEEESDTAAPHEVSVVLAGLSFDTNMTFADSSPVIVNTATFYLHENFNDFEYDPCGCVTESKIFLQLEANLDVGGDAFMIARTTLAASPFVTIGNSCEQTAAVLDASLVEWESAEVFGPDAYTISEETLDWLSGLGLSGSLTFDACQCGACCEACEFGASCTDNAAEGYCSGVWRGADTTCETTGCPSGSCCDPATGACTITPPWGCDEANYTEGGVCDPNPCPQPPDGACCDGEGGCTQTTEANCAGTWSEGVECDPNPCPQLGSCCDPATGNCTQTLEANCAGTWTEGGVCDPNPCPQPPLGACCDGEGGCSQTTQANCFGLWYEGTACDPNPCVLGWCCEYFNGVLVSGFSITEGECEGTDPTVSYVWTEGGEIECPPTNP